MTIARRCRVCLCDDRRMYAISNTVFQEIWERLTNFKFRTNDGKPLIVCYICCAHLRKSQKLMKRALKAEELLTALIENVPEVSQNKILLLASKTHDLAYKYLVKELYQLECNPFKTNTVEGIKQEVEGGTQEVNEEVNYINIEEEEEVSDSHHEDDPDITDIESDTSLDVDTLLKDMLEKECRIVLEKIDIGTPAIEHKLVKVFKMKIYTNKNNTSTLKLLIAAHLAGKEVVLEETDFDAHVFAGPRQLPLLEVDPELIFFSSNAALQYLFPVIDLTDDGQCQQTLEWEATRLKPTVAAVTSSKAVASDLKQVLNALLQTIDSLLEKHKYIMADKLSSADVAIWGTLYPLYYNSDLKQQYMTEFTSITRWIDELASAKAVQDAVVAWGGSANGPFGACSALGIPQVGSLLSPIGTPDDGISGDTGPTPDEVESAKEAWLNGLKNLQPPLKQEKVVLPVKGRKNILVTSALPYVNNVPHLGNIIGCVLSADIFARYCRICDYNTLYICGTDEYGTATETKICDKYFEIHNSVYRWFNIGFDYFGRTSTPEQTELLTSPSARDQCDKCGKLINAIELIEPRCKVCGHKPTVRASEQFFIELGQLEPSIRTWISSVEKSWSPPARAVTRSWLREPLRARAVTRDLKWGVPVPIEQYKNKVFYVWFDAPIGYLSITQNATKQYEKWWKPDKEYDVKLYQFMAKDNVPFHCVMFPATLIGVNEQHILVSHLYATEYLNYEEGKFSKSRGVGVFGNDAQETGIPSDVWRFYLASIRPETSDSSFSWVELGTRNNSELLNNLGNFCHRSLSFCSNTFKGRVPDLTLTQSDYELMALVNREIIAYVQHMEKGRLREALRHVLSISRLGNQHMQSEQPWVLLKGSDDDKQRGATAIGLCCQLVALLCALLAPYIPDTTRRLKEQLNITSEALRINPDLYYLIVVVIESACNAIKSEPLYGRRAKPTKANGTMGISDLEAAVSEQGEKVRKLKASTKDKSAWQPEVDKLLALKRQLAAAQAQPSPSTSGGNVTDLEKAIAEQGDKVRKLKASTNDKAVWQPEVNVLLDLKKKLAALQT
ncbi:hypothetical protein K1T71_014268 [Dendrolimus kikuchii]|uniref:Uncharacterized protein n=1 Tax=Dendrolimus kikuchii TaxID=765133 RepID=A0ACC1CFF9_9NEOP|nr:hypothetical protein K1T71_014268 [Dendrolimus kikuchii]